MLTLRDYGILASKGCVCSEHSIYILLNSIYIYIPPFLLILHFVAKPAKPYYSRRNTGLRPDYLPSTVLKTPPSRTRSVQVYYTHCVVYNPVCCIIIQIARGRARRPNSGKRRGGGRGRRIL